MAAAAIGVVGSLIASKQAAKGAKAGADAQSESTRLGVEEQRRQFDLINSQQGPYRGVGYNSLYAMSDLLGLPGFFGSEAGFTDFDGSGAPGLSADQIRQNLLASGQYNKSGGGDSDAMFYAKYGLERPKSYEEAVGHFRGGGAFGRGTTPQIDILEQFNPQSYWEYAQQGESGGIDEAGLNQAVQAQLAAQGGGGGGGGGSGGAARTPYDFQASPAYQFRFNEGERAANRAYGAAGQRISGNRITGLQNYGQQAASQEFSNQFSRLAQLAGFGLGSTQVTAGAAQNAGNNISALYGQQGAANNQALSSAGQYNAAGILGGARGLANAFNSSGGTNYAGINAGLDNVFSNPSLF